VFFDGSSRLISHNLDSETLRRLYLINDGEVVGNLDR
jgi:hypothetical protein